MTAALQTVGLGRRYGSKWGLKDCTLEVPEGSITGLVGPNGAGKSTLLCLAAGLSRPTTGSVKIFGQEVDPNSTEHLRRIGYFDQLRPLYRGYRVEEMLVFGRRLNATWDDEAVREWLTELDIPMRQKIGQLSLGQQAQVALGMCIGKRPDLLLLDEPVANLDPLARQELLRTLLATVVGRGMTVFLSSHILSELEPICDHLIILSGSTVRIAASTDALLEDHSLLVGPIDAPMPSDLEVITDRTTGRQRTLLVRGHPEDLSKEWEQVQAGLEVIVLAYLARKSPNIAAARSQTNEGETS